MARINRISMNSLISNDVDDAFFITNKLAIKLNSVEERTVIIETYLWQKKIIGSFSFVVVEFCIKCIPNANFSVNEIELNKSA